jgi:hypothetical protein
VIKILTGSASEIEIAAIEKALTLREAGGTRLVIEVPDRNSQ